MTAMLIAKVYKKEKVFNPQKDIHHWEQNRMAYAPCRTRLSNFPKRSAMAAPYSPSKGSMVGELPWLLVSPAQLKSNEKRGQTDPWKLGHTGRACAAAPLSSVSLSWLRCHF